MDRLQELVRLHRSGLGAREVARMLRMGPNTERTYREVLLKAGLLWGSAQELPELSALKAAVLTYKPPKPTGQQESRIASWRSHIESLLDKGLGPKAILDRLRLE